MRFSYDYNAHESGFSWGATAYTETQKGRGAYLLPDRPDLRSIEMRASRVKVASEMIAVADSVKYSIGNGLSGQTASEHCWPGTVHRDGANVLFCDGHVQWYLQSDLVPLPVPRGPSPVAFRNRRLWNNDNRP